MLTPSSLTGIVLAGGKSTRMGTDKAFLKLKGKPFISHILKTINECTEEVFIISSNRKLDGFGVPRFQDLIPELGPLGGIYTGLSHSKTEHNLVVACDTPFLNRETLEQLLQSVDKEHDAFIVQCEGVIMPLIGIYRKSCLPYVTKAIEEKKLGLKKLLTTIRTKIIVLSDSHAKSVLNINTKMDLKKVQNSE